MKTKVFVLFCLIFYLSGCAQYMDRPPTAIGDEATYLEKAMATPLTFSITKEKAEEAWGRINGFIGQYSSMKIQTASQYIIQTYNPSDTIHYGYSANRAQKGDEYEFSVSCFSGGGFGGVKKIPNQNAHILAHYALTGEIIPHLVVQ
jgi:hypothetical protein